MIEDLFDFYNDNLTFESTVIRKNGFLRNSPFYLLIISFISFGITYLLTQKVIFGIISIIISIIAVFVSRFTTALIIKKKYPEHWLSCINWSTKGFNKMYLDRLEKYLEKIDDNKLNKIQELIKDRASRERIPSIVFISSFAALFIPLWGSYINAIMDSLKQNEIEMGIGFLVFFLLIISLSLLCPMLVEIRDNLITRYMKWNRLNDLISELRLRK